MKTLVQGLRRASLARMWSQLSRRQRQALMALGLANLTILGLGVLVVLTLRTPPLLDNAHLASPLSLKRVQTCRQQVSQALFDAGHTGTVQTGTDGVILLHLKRSTANSNPRLVADAATWAALEAIALAGPDDCPGFRIVQVTVAIQTTRDHTSYATARAGLADLLLWSQGEIDDAELALRLDYRPPSPDSLE